MSLDRFRDRGFSRTGMAPLGQKSSISPDKSETDTGTSFVLGASPTSSVAYHQRALESKSQRRVRLNDYEFDPHEIRHTGTANRTPVPSGCFGYRGESNDSMASSQKTIVFVFLVVIALIGAIYKMGHVSDHEGRNFIHLKLKREISSPQAPERAPSWDRN